MIKIILYMMILIACCYVLDYFYLKSREALKELKEAYISLKKAKKDLYV
jgi:hypothetical protein